MRSGLAAFAVALLALASWAYQHRDLPWTLFSGDENEYAEIGRRIASGRGFTTGMIYPIEIAQGVGPEHPALLRPPLWPLVLAGGFSVGGTSERTAHAMAALCYVALGVLATLLADRLGGPLAALVGGAAAVLAADVAFYAGLAGTETLAALCVTGWLLLLVRGAPAVAVGAVCGLAYLTRYNAGILLPLSLLALTLSGGSGRLRRALACAAGFALVCAPWWIRNAAVTGSPFFSFYRVTLWETPGLLPWNGSLLNEIDPGPGSLAWIAPAEKIRLLLPVALSVWPVPAANLPAFAGVLLGAWKRERACWLLLAALIASKLAVVPFAVRSRYDVPFIPAAIAVGAAAWAVYGGRLRVPALVAIPLALLLPALPNADHREALHRGVVEAARADGRSGGSGAAARAALHARRAQCLGEHPLVIAADAPGVTWEWDTVALFQPTTDTDFWRLVDEYPVRFALLPAPEGGPARARFDARFSPRPECGPDLFERR